MISIALAEIEAKHVSHWEWNHERGDLGYSDLG